MSLLMRGLLVSSLVFVTACSSVGKKSKNVSAEGGAAQAASEVIDEKEVSSEEVELNENRPYKSSYGNIPMDHNPMVQKWIDYFQGRGRGYMETYLSRSSRYLPMMKNELRQQGLPEELVYVALIESGFSPLAHSHANAVGYWQFIRSTGRRFGLHVDPFIDERRDPVLSTRAAARYFKALYEILGSWHLALAAYNVGESKVKRLVTRHFTRDYWELIKKRRSLPAETKNYVPKFIAAAMIAKDPKKYGFADVDYQDPLSYDTVSLQSPISLTKLATNLNVDVDELKLLNPKFRSDFVPISRGSETVVRLPVGRGTDAIAALSLSGSTEPKIYNAENFFYRIRRGDNLSTIARKHRTTVSRLRRLNDLSNRTILRVGMRLKVPDNGGSGHIVSEEDANERSPSSRQIVKTAGPSSSSEIETPFHVVRSGENLTLIARRYGLSVPDILRMNNLTNRSVIKRGQKIRVRNIESEKNAGITETRTRKRIVPTALSEFKVRSGGKDKKISAAKSLSITPVKASRAAGNSQTLNAIKKHVVRRGETLYDVAKKYGVALNRIARANNVKASYRVLAGEKLLIPIE